MNILSFMNKITAIGKYLAVTVAVMSFLPVVFASSAIFSTMMSLCSISQVFLGGAVMVLMVLAGATYAIGQVMGAETRARAAVWATSMLTGAIIGAVIYIIAPIMVSGLLSGSMSGVTFSPDNPCGATQA